MKAPRRIGVGTAKGHHGELLQGAFEQAGAIVRGLVTLPFPLGESTAEFVASEDGSTTCSVSPPHKRKAARAARLTLAHMKRRSAGTLQVSSNIPQGFGLGSSTADVVASIRAVANAFGRSLPAVTIGVLAVAAEAASDPVMFERPLLFAHREGRTIEDLGPLPELTILSFVWGPPVDTLRLPRARYSDSELRRFGELRERLRASLRSGDAAELSFVATESARINQSRCPISNFESYERIADETGALGIQVSHSGAVAGLLFDARSPHIDRDVMDARTAIGEHGVTVGPLFGTPCRRDKTLAYA